MLRGHRETKVRPGSDAERGRRESGRRRQADKHVGGLFHPLRICLSWAFIFVGGCTSLPPDLGRGQVDRLVVERGYRVDREAEDLLASLVSTPLSVEGAVTVALINNPELQSSYARLGFGAADVYAAGRIHNPVLSAVSLQPKRGGEGSQTTFGLVASFTELITLGARSRLAEDAHAALRQQTGAEVLAMAASTEKAYYKYVAALQIATLRRRLAQAGALSAALAERFREAGNLSPRELAMERAAASEAGIGALEAEGPVLAARTELASLLGLSTGDAWQVPAVLHLPPEDEASLSSLLVLAETQHLMLAAARTQVEVLTRQLDLVARTRWLGDLDVGIEQERETDGTRLRGPVVEWTPPIFTQHRDQLLRAEAELQVAVNQVRRISLDMENGLRLAHAAMMNARARIREYQRKLIPQRIEVVARAQEEVNFMLIGIFELIALKQEEYGAYQSYLEAISDYWLSRADLAYAAGTSLPGPVRTGAEPVQIESLLHSASDVPAHTGQEEGHGNHMQHRHSAEGTPAGEEGPAEQQVHQDPGDAR